ncbi:hypothetical protein [Aminobacter aminovorans]|uniref:hypothetical protein n=1 Tax=Aminobacter TaxID=31988 RepID=UPI00285F0C5B|nr:hypothetical protein [Aminobacter aminovorans]MDR7222626.1 hypothetical protein [Aminobacter aminovorans]
MNLTMRLTLDGLKRALRWKAHELAEDIEQDYRGDVGVSAEAPPRRASPRRIRERDDDRPGR